MASKSAPSPSPPKEPAATGLIAGRFSVDFGQPLAGAAGGLPAYAAVDHSDRVGGLMAVQVPPQRPARARAISLLTQTPIEGLLAPVGHGTASLPSGEQGYFVVCQATPGPSLAERPRPWSETELLDCLVRPVAHVLDRLQALGVTHRAIRPDNLFRGGPGMPVVLGCAWAVPPASSQPALFEPPYVAMCLPCGRSDGSIGDDVYALGVTVLVLALGRLPMASLGDQAVIRRKLDLGSFTALLGEERLPPMISDLLLGMLAEDPDHRPSPALLADPASARARRPAARPPQRAERPLEVGEAAAWNARSLAYALAQHPEQGVQALRSGFVDRWLRRGLGAPTLATRLEEIAGYRHSDTSSENTQADSFVALSAIALLDPLAPLCWREIAIWPDGLGTALAAAESERETRTKLEELIVSEASATWAGLRPERCDVAATRAEGRQYRSILRLRGVAGTLSRLTYTLNPMLPCASTLLRGRWVSRIEDLLSGLESVAQSGRPEGSPVDSEIGAFIAARLDGRLDQKILAALAVGAEGLLAQLTILATLQVRARCGPLPALATWLLRQGSTAVAALKNKPRREAVGEQLAQIASSGRLDNMLALLSDPKLYRQDEQELQQARLAHARIEKELARLADGTGLRTETAHRIGQEIAAAAGIAALALVLIMAALG